MSSWKERLWPSRWGNERIVFEDDALVVIDKPAHLDCSALRRRLNDRGKLWLPQTIDASLSGVVALAKTQQAHRELVKQLEGRVPRSYALAVHGRGVIDVTSRKEPKAVRREHAARLIGDGHPAHRVMMHVRSLELRHPIDGTPLSLAAPVPKALHRAERPALPKSLEEWVQRIEEAADARCEIAASDTDAFRIVNSGGDELPGVEIDRYGEHVVVGLRSDEAVAEREALFDALDHIGVAGVYLKIRQKHASVLVATRGQPFAPADPIRGAAAPSPLWIRENGVALRTSLGDGLSTGVFLDQRDGRGWVRDRGDSTHLNLFAYHGAFTVAAIAGGCRQSVTVDASGVAVEASRQNVEAAVRATGREGEQHDVVKVDAFRFLQGAAKRGRKFDTVCLDPPSFSTTKKSRFSASRDYVKLAALTLRCVAKGGALLACTNHRGIEPRKFAKMLDRAADEAGVRVARRWALPPPSDFPPEPGQDHHLKRVVVEVAT